MKYRKILTAVALMLTAVTSFAQQNSEILRPAPLHPGDTIAIISPASAPEARYITEGIKALRKWGYVAIAAPNALARYGTYAGTPKQRLADLRWAFENPNIKAVFCSRGGYGSIQVIEQLPEGYFAKHPKWLIGFSDITALLLANVSDGVMSIHGPMCEFLMHHGGTDFISDYYKQIFKGENVTYELPATHPYNHQGVAEGVLIGGNFSILNDISNTPIDYLSWTDKKIVLFVEDVDENIHKINRILHRLKFGGYLENVVGIIVGNFRGYGPMSPHRTMEDTFNSVVGNLNIPIVYNYPTGHGIYPNYPLIEGCPVRLTVTDQTSKLEFLSGVETTDDESEEDDDVAE